MKILYTLPGIEVPHGGYRIILEHLTRLRRFGHKTALLIEGGKAFCPWYDVSNIPIYTDKTIIHNFDCIVIGSPHSIWIEDQISAHQKVFLFMQMEEKRFRPNDHAWHNTCDRFYHSAYPLIHGSEWGAEYLKVIGRIGKTFYLDNGVNLDHFPLSRKPKDGYTILVEGWNNNNPAKDTDNIGPAVAQALKKKGYKVLAYGFHPLTKFHHAVDEYYYRPDLATMNQLYEDATILIKATKYDARALSPIEAMTKGTVTARAIIKGDDDLRHGINCLRTGYDGGKLYEISLQLLEDETLRNYLSDQCINYVQEHCNWDKIIDKINKILTA